MFIDATTRAGTVQRTDVCIIGAGPAGITVAAELTSSGLSVTVLEIGGEYHDRHDRGELVASLRDHVRGAQSAARGSNTGQPYFPLRLSRVRGIGGATAGLLEHGLRARPLDRIDFESPGSGRWPIGFDDLETHLGAASDYCGITHDGDPWTAPEGAILGGESGVVDVAFRHGARAVFADRAESLAGDPDQTWIINAAATKLDVDTSGHVTRVHVKAGGGEGFVVESRFVVLATGGLDNARTLLSNEPVLAAMGPAAANVGRNFMEHMHYVAGHLVPRSDTARSAIAERYCDIGEEIWLTVDDEVVRTEGLARTAFLPVPAYLGSLSLGANAMARLLKSVPYGPFDASLWRSEFKTIWKDRKDVPGFFTDRLKSSRTRDCFAVSAMSEQTPNPDSFVALSDKLDRYGLRLPILHWDVAGKDWDAARRSMDHLSDALAASDLGDFVPAWTADERGPAAYTGGWHHMGTTRMSSDPNDGVVDTDLSAHGVANLYVAGSSVFPTSGFANPTLTLVALAIRLGRHVRDVAAV